MKNLHWEQGEESKAVVGWGITLRRFRAQEAPEGSSRHFLPGGGRRPAAAPPICQEATVVAAEGRDLRMEDMLLC